MKAYRILLAASLITVNPLVIADVLVSNIDEEGNESVVKLSNDWGKVVDKSAPNQFMLIDMKKEAFYVVDDQEKMVVRIGETNTMQDMNPHKDMTQKQPVIEVKKVGAGQSIAGYKTIHYKLIVDGEFCSDHFISMDLLKNAEIKAFADSMQKFAKSEMPMGFNESPCEVGETYFDNKVFEYGVPLLSKDASGKDVFKITEINTKASFSKDEFKLPEGYPVFSQAELMQREMRRGGDDMSEGGSGIPDEDMEKLMEQLSPEEMQQIQEQMQKQLQQIQEMMKQQNK